MIRSVLLVVSGAVLTVACPSWSQSTFFDFSERSWQSLYISENTSSVALGDVDGDGDLDLVCGNRIQRNTVYYCLGDGEFSPIPAWQSESEFSDTRAVALGDIDGDGDLDIVYGNNGEKNWLYLNDEGTFFFSGWTSDQSNDTRSITLGDVDGDGDLDLVCGNEGQSNTLYLNDQGLFSTSPAWSSTPRPSNPFDTDRRTFHFTPSGSSYTVSTATFTFDEVLGTNLGLTDDGNSNQSLPFTFNYYGIGWNDVYVNANGLVSFGVIPSGYYDKEDFFNEAPKIAVYFMDLNPGAGGGVYFRSDATKVTITWNGVFEFGTTNANTIQLVLYQDGSLDLTFNGISSTLQEAGPPIAVGIHPGGSPTLDVVSFSNDLPFVGGPGAGFYEHYTDAVFPNTLGVALGDVDGDGDLDLVCGNSNQPNTVYLNAGGDFGSTPAWSSDPSNHTTSVALGDITGNGHLDLVCGNWAGPNTLYRNDGGTLDTAADTISSVAKSTAWVALGDIDADGDLDLVSGNAGETNSIYENVGGTFAGTPVGSPEAKRTYSVALGDIDGDGYLDLVEGNDNSANTLWLSERVTSLSDREMWSSDPTNWTMAVAAGDIDGDGNPELICGNWVQPNTLYRNEGSVFGTQPVWSSALSESTRSVAIGDIDGDKDLDVVFGNDGKNTLYENVGGVLSDLPVWSSGPSYHTFGVALGDVDRDGDLDLVCGNEGQVNTLYANEGGAFAQDPVWNSVGSINLTWAVALGDVDGDEDLDLVVGNNGTNQLYLNNQGSFSRNWSSVRAFGTRSVALGDVDADGDLDLVCGNTFNNNTLYLNEGGTFTNPPAWETGPPVIPTRSVALADLDGDGRIDLVCGNGIGNTLYRGLADGTFEDQQRWTSGLAKQTTSVVLNDVDRDGDLDVVCGNANDHNSLYTGLRLPPLHGALVQPVNHTPNNGTHLRFVSVTENGANARHISFQAFDVESDPLFVSVEYQYAGEPRWFQGKLVGDSRRAGPFVSSPDGVPGAFEWDVTPLDFDSRDVLLRLRVQELPSKVSLIQHASPYVVDLGPITPIRPMIGVVDTVSFSVVSVGDTLTQVVSVFNRGNETLAVSDIQVPPGLRVEPQAPFDIPSLGSSDLTVSLEPTIAVNPPGDIIILSNDPLISEKPIRLRTDIRPLAFTTRLLTTEEELVLGEAVTVDVSPAPFVRIDGGYVLHRSAGSPEFRDSVPLEAFESGFLAVIPGSGVTEAGLEYYIRVENSGVFGTDPPNAPDSVYAYSVASPGGFSSDPVETIENGFFERRPVNVQIVLPSGTVFEGGTLYYREGGAMKSYGSTTVLVGDALPVAVIPDSVVGGRGVEYWIEIETATRTLTDPPVDPSDRPHSIPVVVENLTEPSRRSGGQYRLLSFPLKMRGTIAGSLQDELGGPDATKWRMFAYVPNDAGYIELPNADAELTSIEQGRAYWLITRNDHQIGTGDDLGETARTDRPYEITLEPGYSLIGNPFNFPVEWNSAMVGTVSVTEAPFDTVLQRPVGWVPGSYLYDVLVLEPFEGYWVKNRGTTPLVLEIPAIEASRERLVALSRPAKDGDVEDIDAWRSWRIGVRVSSTGVEDRGGLLGVQEDATSTWDHNDREMPPMHPGRFVALYFPREQGGTLAGPLAHDIRGDYEVLESDRAWGHAWHFDVAKSFADGTAGDEVRLEFSGIDGVSDEAEVRLVDRRLERLVDLRQEDLYTFYLGERSFIVSEDDARFVLLVGSEEFIAQAGSPLARVPTKTALHQNIPNPFNPSTIIRYDIAARGWVRVRVYDVSGALVRVLEDREREPGVYAIGWNGDTEHGGRAASGVYFYRLTAPGFSQTRKMVLLK